MAQSDSLPLQSLQSRDHIAPARSFVGNAESALLDVVEEIRIDHPERTVTFEVRGDQGSACDERVISLFRDLLAQAITSGTPKSVVRARVFSTSEEFVMDLWNNSSQADFDGASAPLTPRLDQPADLAVLLRECAMAARSLGGSLRFKSSSTTVVVRLPR